MAFIELTEESGRKFIVNTDSITKIRDGLVSGGNKLEPTKISTGEGDIKIEESYKTMRNIMMAMDAVFYDSDGIIMKDQAMTEQEFMDANSLPDVLRKHLEATIKKSEGYDIEDPIERASCRGFVEALQAVLKILDDWEAETRRQK